MSRIRQLWSKIVTGGVALLVLAACGATAPAASPAASPSSPKPAASSQTAQSSLSTGAPAASAQRSAVASTAPKPAAAGSKPITIAWTAAAAAYGPYWFAVDRGFFAKHNAAVQLQFIAPAAGFQALAARNIDIVATAGDPTLRSQGVDVKYFGGVAHWLSNGLYGRKGMPSSISKELEGKTVAVTSPGSATDIYAREALSRNGVDVSKVNFVYTQSVPAMFAGLSAGKFDMATMSPPFSFKLTPDIVTLSDIGAIKVPFLTAAPLAYTEWISSHDNEAKGILQGLQDGIAFAKANRDEAEQILGKYLEESDKSILDSTYKLDLEVWGVPDLAVDKESLQNAIKYAVKANPKAASVTPDEMIYQDNKLAKAAAAS